MPDAQTVALEKPARILFVVWDSYYLRPAAPGSWDHSNGLLKPDGPSTRWSGNKKEALIEYKKYTDETKHENYFQTGNIYAVFHPAIKNSSPEVDK